MEVKATSKYARISPLKARHVTRAIQGMPVSDALDILTFTPRKAAHLVGKALKSAIANAENNHDMAVDSLVVKEAAVGDGPAFKRWKARARGGASPIRKRTSHIFITLTDEIEIPEPTKKSGKTKKKKRFARAAATKKLIEQLGKGKGKGKAAPAPAPAEEPAEAEVEPEAVEEAAAPEAIQEEEAAAAPVAEEEAAPVAEEEAAEEGTVKAEEEAPAAEEEAVEEKEEKE